MAVQTMTFTGRRLALLAALTLALASCATVPAGPIPRVIDVTNTHRAAG